MKKGAVSVIVIAFVIISLVISIEGVYFVNYATKTQTSVRLVREAELIKAINTMEAARRAMLQALPYTIHQSSYDVLKRGGFCEDPERENCGCLIPQEVPSFRGIPWWRIYTETYAPDLPDTSIDGFFGNLSDRMAYIFNLYGAEMPVTVPDYYPQPPGEVTIEETEDGMKVNAASEGMDGKMKLTGNFYEITESAEFPKRIEINTIKMYRLGKENFVDRDRIEDAVLIGIITAVNENNLPFDGKKTGPPGHCSDGISCPLTPPCGDCCRQCGDPMLPPTCCPRYSCGDFTSKGSCKCGCEWNPPVCPSAAKVFKSAADMSFDEAENKIKINITKNIKALEKELNDGSEFKVEIDITSESKIVSKCEDDGGDPCTTTCSFYYYGSASVTVEITDEENEYIIYDDGSTDMRKLTLKFRVVFFDCYSCHLEKDIMTLFPRSTDNVCKA